MVTGAISQFIETVNLPMTCETHSKNENTVSSPTCIFCVCFIAIEHPKHYPPPANPNDLVTSEEM